MKTTDIDSLPNELHMVICEYGNVRDTGRLMAVSTHWNQSVSRSRKHLFFETAKFYHQLWLAFGKLTKSIKTWLFGPNSPP